LLSRNPVPIRGRRGERRELPFIFVVGADDDVKVSLTSLGEMSLFLGEKLLQAGEVHDGR